MKLHRMIALIIVVVLVATLAVPVIAVAAGAPEDKGRAPEGRAPAPGKPESPAEKKGNDTGPAKPVQTPAQVAPVDSPGRADSPPGAARKPETTGTERAEQVRARPDEGLRDRSRRGIEVAPGKSVAAQIRAKVHLVDEAAATEGEAAVAGGKERGIDNALSRIMRSIQRTEASIEAGEPSPVPPGLLRVMAKFLGWLGVDQETQIIDLDLE